MRRSLILLVVCACGSSSSFTGSVDSNTFSVNDSAFVAGQEIWFSSDGALCDHLKASQFPKGGTIVKIIPHPVAKADFTVNPSQAIGNADTIFLQFFKFDDTCMDTLPFGPSIATTGTATISEVDPMKSIQGYFSVTFGNADHVTGTINAQFCDAPTLYMNPDCK